MASKTVLFDDYDGKELADGTRPIKLSLEGTAYDLHLSEENHGKLREVLAPFIETADRSDTDTTGTDAPSGSGGPVISKKDKKDARTWAIETGFKYQGPGGKMVTAGRVGKLADAVIKEWRAQGSPILAEGGETDQK